MTFFPYCQAPLLITGLTEEWFFSHLQAYLLMRVYPVISYLSSHERLKITSERQVGVDRAFSGA